VPFGTVPFSSSINASAQKYLSFRVGLYRSVAAATSLTIMLEDAIGHQVFIDIAELGALTTAYTTEFGGWLLPPRGAPPGTPAVQADPDNITKTAMRTYRIDLAALRYNARDFDNSQITTVRFIFDRNQTGRAIFDDIEFTN